jgi:hypothetical protein
MTYDRLKEYFDDKKEVIYLLKDKTRSNTIKQNARKIDRMLLE